MISYFKKLFGYKALYDTLKKQHIETLEELKRMAIRVRDLEVKAITPLGYAAIKKFDKEDRAFVQKIAAIHDSEEMNFMIYDLKMQCVENMVNGSVDVNLQMTGVLKGIDMILRNLIGYKALWTKMIDEANRNA
jgi:hypothetical protein